MFHVISELFGLNIIDFGLETIQLFSRILLENDFAVNSCPCGLQPKLLFEFLFLELF